MHESILKNAYKKNLYQKHYFDSKKYAQCWFKKVNFWIFCCRCLIKSWKKCFFWIFFFISYQKIPLVFLLENIPYFNFLITDGWAMSIYNFLLLRLCKVVVWETSQNCFRFLINLVNYFSLLIWVGKKIRDDRTASSA